MNVVVLAAGMGRRMCSDLPKVLHALAGRPLLAHVLDRARSLSPNRIVVVYGHGGDAVPDALAAKDVVWAKQEPQLGTGHAVAQAVPSLDDASPTLVLYGDVPLTRPETLARLAAAAGADKLAILTAVLGDPGGYGRIVREHGRIVRIVEEKDADAATKTIRETNTGILVAPTPALKRWLASLSNDNAQGEYYLTDVVARAVAEGVPVVSASPENAWETLGVNSKAQLAELERVHQRNVADALLIAGVTLADPARIDVRGALECGRDVSIDVNCVFEGRVVLGEDVHVGNFVEMKNAKVAANSKANHLAYVGDAVIGERVNIGAGTITCNYDGANKWQTVIEDDAFIGSDTQLVAPVRVGRGATLGAGTTLTRDAPEGKLTVSRAKQATIEHWQRPVKGPRGGKAKA